MTKNSKAPERPEGPGQAKEERVARLKALSQAKREANELRIREAITRLDHARLPITLAAVAREAGVSRQTVYSSPFAGEVQQLARKTAGLAARPAVAALPSEAAWRRRVQDLQDEVRTLKAKLEVSEARVKALLAEVAS